MSLSAIQTPVSITLTTASITLTKVDTYMYTRAVALESTFLSTPTDFKYTAICGGDGLKELCNKVS